MAATVEFLAEKTAKVSAAVGFRQFAAALQGQEARRRLGGPSPLGPQQRLRYAGVILPDWRQPA
jgi:hypothetical protein